MADDLTASVNYFRAAGIPIVAGRPFAVEDAPDAVAIVSESVARVFGVEPRELIGRRIILRGVPRRPNVWGEIVGVAGDVALRGPEDMTNHTIYRPLGQAGSPREHWAVVSAVGEAVRLGPSIRAAIARVEPTLPPHTMRTFRQVRAATLSDRRFTMVVMSVYAALTFALAAIGLYGVIAYVVQLRSRELGIRLALGASPARLRRHLLVTGLALGAGGICVGTVAALAASRVLWATIPGFGEPMPADVAAIGAAILVMALASTWLPAHRATTIDPMAALRAE